MSPRGWYPRAPIRCTTSLTCSGSLPAAATYCPSAQLRAYVPRIGLHAVLRLLWVLFTIFFLSLCPRAHIATHTRFSVLCLGTS
jgi:hypothetical protein